jgi:hypothetical protein
MSAYVNAMHIHNSFSEGLASLQASMAEAVRSGVDVLWPTNHDWRMSAQGYRQVQSFDSMQGGTEGPNPGWIFHLQSTGKLAKKVGIIVTSPVSSADPSSKGSLHVAATGKNAPLASVYVYAQTNKARQNQRANITGQTLTIDVLPTSISPDAWLEIPVNLSYRPAMNGRPAGVYQLCYRFGTAPASRSTDSGGLRGIINVPVPTAQWSTVLLDLEADAAALWPDVNAKDNALSDIWFGASSQNRAPAEGYFDYLRFSRDTAGDKALQVLDELIGSLGPMYPNLTVHRGLEISLFDPHSNWFGGDQHLPDYHALVGDQVHPAANDNFTSQMSDLIHQSGGLSSVNHPFGTSETQQPLLSPSAQAALVAKTAAHYIGNRAYRCDIIEAGYQQRGGVDLDGHLELADIMTRNGIWLTYNGVSDDHNAQVGNWTTDINQFATVTWAQSVQMSDLLAAIAAGRAFCRELGTTGSFDTTVDDIVPMGAISVRPDKSQRTFTIAASDLDPSAHVDVVQGLIDYSGSASTRDQLVATIPASALTQGPVSVTLDTSTSSYVRANYVVPNSQGVLVRRAFTNPTMLLRSDPPPSAPIPSARISPDNA